MRSPIAAKTKARAAFLKAVKNAKAKTAAYSKAMAAFKKQNSDKISDDPEFRRLVEEIDRRLERANDMLRLLEEDSTNEAFKLLQA